MVHSMTGFASSQGHGEAGTWTWDMRSVNGRGLDIRVRLPDGFEALEPKIRKAVSARCHRGNISIGLRVKTSTTFGDTLLNAPALDAMLGVVGQVEQIAMDQGVTLAPMSAADVLNMRGVLDMGSDDSGKQALVPVVEADFTTVLEAFCKARASEGQAMADVLHATLQDIRGLCAEVSKIADQRIPKMQAVLTANVKRLLNADDSLDGDRLAQELALLSVKSDITEEIDRLSAHIDAGFDLLKQDGPIGRKFDFLTQEFNREVNTICSKSGDSALTQVGLTLKTRIDQMREQVQNVE